MRLIVLCAATLVGVAAGDLARLDAGHLGVGMFLALAGLGVARHRPICRLVALVTCAAALGGLRATLAAPTAGESALGPFVGQTVRLRGEVVQPPTLGLASVQVQVDVAAIGVSPNPAGTISAIVGAVRDPAGVVEGIAGAAGGPIGVVERTANAAGGPAELGKEEAAQVAEDPTGAPGETAGVVPGTPGETAGLVPGVGVPGDEMALLDTSAGVPRRVRVVGDPSFLRDVSTGEMLVLEGRLLPGGDRAGPPTVLFPRLLDRQPPGPPTRPAALLATLRGAAEASIHRSLPEPQASLATGVLLGGSSGLDPDLRLQLQRSGLSHLVAIDGFKLTVLTAALGGLAVRALGPRLATVPIGLGMAGYTLLTGAHASAVRAALMLGLAMLAGLGGRVTDPLTSVLVATVVMVGVEPRILLDLGLQLSLSATLGIVLLWPRWRNRLQGVPPWIAEPAGLTLAVTCATLPVTLSVFALVSLVSPLAHVLGVPLLAPVVLSAGLLAVVSPVPPLGILAGWLAWLPTTLLLEVIRVCGALPGAAVTTGRLPPAAATALAAAVLSWGVLGLPEAAPVHHAWARLRAWCGDWWTPAAALATGLSAIGVMVMLRSDQRLHVRTLSAGRGQAVLVRGPTGRTALVVSGRPDGSLLASQVADRLAVWEHKLDYVLQLDSATAAGLAPTLARYPPVERLNTGENQRVDLGGGAVLDVSVSSAQPGTPQVDVAFGRISLPLTDMPTGSLASDGNAVWIDEAQVP